MTNTYKKVGNFQMMTTTTTTTKTMMTCTDLYPSKPVSSRALNQKETLKYLHKQRSAGEQGAKKCIPSSQHSIPNDGKQTSTKQKGSKPKAIKCGPKFNYGGKHRRIFRFHEAPGTSFGSRRVTKNGAFFRPL